MKFGFVMQHRLFSFGEGIRGMRLSSEQNPERSAATGDASSTTAGNITIK
jgi:hypothetical protein